MNGYISGITELVRWYLTLRFIPVHHLSFSLSRTFLRHHQSQKIENLPLANYTCLATSYSRVCVCLRHFCLNTEIAFTIFSVAFSYLPLVTIYDHFHARYLATVINSTGSARVRFFVSNRFSESIYDFVGFISTIHVIRQDWPFLAGFTAYNIQEHHFPSIISFNFHIFISSILNYRIFSFLR